MRIPATAKLVLPLAAFWLAASHVQATADTDITYMISGDRIEAPLAGLAGDAERGRRIVLDRAVGNCLICHAVPEPNELFMGNLGPPLEGIGRTLSSAQLRLRVVDARRLNENTIMPPYHRTSGLSRVAPQYRGKPVLSAQDVEDVVAYLVSLQ